MDCYNTHLTRTVIKYWVALLKSSWRINLSASPLQKAVTGYYLRVFAVDILVILYYDVAFRPSGAGYVYILSRLSAN